MVNTQNAPVDDNASMGAARIRVLLVDDHVMFTESLSRILASESDIEVVGAVTTASDALRGVATHRPDVVLMDFELPDGTGTTAAALVKRDFPETAVVMLTAHIDEQVLLDAIEAGCSGYVTKDEAVREVVAAVRAAHAGEALISPQMLARLLPRLRRASQLAGRANDLTTRELEVLRLLAQGLTNQEIADRLMITLNTARNHVQATISKMEAHSKLEAVASAVRSGIIRYE